MILAGTVSIEWWEWKPEYGGPRKDGKRGPWGGRITLIYYFSAIMKTRNTGALESQGGLPDWVKGAFYDASNYIKFTDSQKWFRKGNRHSRCRRESGQLQDNVLVNTEGLGFSAQMEGLVLARRTDTRPANHWLPATCFHSFKFTRHSTLHCCCSWYPDLLIPSWYTNANIWGVCVQNIYKYM